MANTYKYNSRKHRPLGHFFLRAGEITIVIAGVGFALYLLFIHFQPKTKIVNGKGVVVAQVNNAPPTITITEPTYSFKLPFDWIQTASEDIPTNHSVTWQATAKNYADRILTIYMDPIPQTVPVNAELPIQPEGNTLSVGQLSENCSNFTPGGTQNTIQAETLPPKVSEWDSVSFMCDLARFTDNQIGTGTIGSPINTTTVVGPKSGSHNYFFLYSDRNIVPDETILDNALSSFKAL